MTSSRVGPRLRAAVDASLSWYDALCALHAVPCGIEDDVWLAYSTPPPLHSTAKTVEPTARADRILAALGPHGHGSIADSFGVLDLTDAGFRLLFEARWVHHPGQNVSSRRLPAGWAVVRTATELANWTARHDTAAVLLPGLLARSAFCILAKRAEDQLVAGAVLHLNAGVVYISNVWTHRLELDWSELVNIAGALYPERSLVGYESGEDLERARMAGFHDIGPQRVWIR